MLSKNPRTHYILVKEGEGARISIKKIAITKAQKDFYKDELEIKKHFDFITIEDPDTKKILFDGRASKIEGFEEIKKDPEIQQKRWVCDFGVRHQMSMVGECECVKEYDSLPRLFIDKVRKLGYNITYTSDITDEMRLKYKQSK